MRKEVIAHKDPKSPISEVFRTLRTNIQFMNTSKKLKTLLITSTFPNEGKSWVTSNLAVTFAQAGKRVILVDADMRKGRQYAIFGVSPRPGLSNYLSGIDSNSNEQETQDVVNYIQETEVENLYVLPAGNIPPNPSELLVSASMVGLLEELREMCDLVIIDGTPCELVTDSIILARLVDSTVIVTAHKETKKDALERVIRNIQNVGGKLAGVVINKMPVTAKKYSESYYYGTTQPKSGKEKLATRHGNKPNIAKNLNPANSKREQLKKRVKPETISTNQIENRMRQKEESITPHLDMPKALQAEAQKEIENEISIDKTNDILSQINQYLENEKKNLE